MANIKGTYGRFACIPEGNWKLLLAQRRWRTDPITKLKVPDERWNYLGGGVDEKDSEKSATIQEIIAREVREESGLEVVIMDFRPVGEYATAKHTDVAITYLCRIVGGALTTTEESMAFQYITPAEAMKMALKGDVPDGLVGGIKTSGGGVPRHIQMVLHFFTRVCQNRDYRNEADRFCQELGIPI
jgi:8-oxo-dGTP pyrophosphatase MutT (NUDIX family)